MKELHELSKKILEKEREHHNQRFILHEEIDQIIREWLKEKAKEIDILPLKHEHSKSMYDQINEILGISEKTLEEKIQKYINENEGIPVNGKVWADIIQIAEEHFKGE